MCDCTSRSPGIRSYSPDALSSACGFRAKKGQANPGILFLARGNGASAGVTAQSVLYSPLGAALDLLASNPNPAVSPSNPLPGLVNSYTGADPHKWVTGITRYTTIKLSAVFPGIDAQYTISSDGVLTLSLLLAAGVDPTGLQFQIAEAASITLASDSSLVAKIGSASEFASTLVYPVPVALQGSGLQVSRSVSFAVQSTTTFGLVVQGLTRRTYRFQYR